MWTSLRIWTETCWDRGADSKARSFPLSACAPGPQQAGEGGGNLTQPGHDDIAGNDLATKHCPSHLGSGHQVGCGAVCVKERRWLSPASDQPLPILPGTAWKTDTQDLGEGASSLCDLLSPVKTFNTKLFSPAAHCLLFP